MVELKAQRAALTTELTMANPVSDNHPIRPPAFNVLADHKNRMKWEL